LLLQAKRGGVFPERLQRTGGDLLQRWIGADRGQRLADPLAQLLGEAIDRGQ
jgi:hypothetical protein